jgi:metal-responsive CopG/Arc/MetJ family transcriptional regulator
MKTDISIPNPIYQAADKLAKKLGISMSELYATAVATYVLSHEQDQVTELLDKVYQTESSTLESGLVKIQVESMDGGDW